MLKKGRSDEPIEPEERFVEEQDLPLSGGQMHEFLIKALSSNYKDKFGTKHISQKNVFSVSALVSGPGNTAYQYRRTLEETDANGEEAKVFNYAMFRGSAIHDYSNKKLSTFYSYEKQGVREEFPYAWRDPAYKTIVIQGHPDLVHYGRLVLDGVVYCDDPGAGVLLEIKTLASNEEDPKKLAQYKKTVIKKAKRQGGCYATMLSNELHRPHFVYVVTFEDRPEKRPITQADTAQGFAMINDGTFKLELDDRIIKRGYVYDSSLRVYPLTKEEIHHGYSYCRWSACEAAKILEEEPKNAS
jgi:hypothetical protein